MHWAFFTFAAFVTGSMMEGYPGHLVQQQSVYITHRSPPSRSSPAFAAVLSPVLSPGPPSRPRSRPRRSLSPHAASLIVPIISSTFSLKSAIAKFRNARQTKMADVDSNTQHRHVTLKKTLHLTRTLAARCPNAKLVPKHSLFHGKKYFSASVWSVSLWFGILVPVRCWKQSRYTGVRRLALTYHAAGIPASDATGKFAQSRYTGVRRHREVCAKSVYRLPTS